MNIDTSLNKKRIGVGICGSFCTFSKAFNAIQNLINCGAEVTAIVSSQSKDLNTRFGKSSDHLNFLQNITGKEVLKSIVDTEPIGPQKMFDLLLVAPCTGNTLAKLATGIIDTPVTMAVKSHLRGNRPVVLAVSTNDGLGSSAKNIGILLNYKNYYFLPMGQDDYIKKPNSIVADYEYLIPTIASALNNTQLQPILLSPKGGIS